MVGYIADAPAMGLPVAKGLTLTETFYWDLNDRTRAFQKRIAPKIDPAYLFEVKKPEESASRSVIYKRMATLAADEAFRPIAEGECPQVEICNVADKTGALKESLGRIGAAASSPPIVLTGRTQDTGDDAAAANVGAFREARGCVQDINTAPDAIRSSKRSTFT